MRLAGSPHVLQFKCKQSACIQQDVQLNVLYSIVKAAYVARMGLSIDQS